MKSSAVQDTLDNLSLRFFGRTRGGAIEEGVCVLCGGPTGVWRDEVSRKEYAISGLCQECQDGVFEEDGA